MSYTQSDLEPPLAGTALNGITPVDLTTATTVVAHIKRPDWSIISRAVTLGNQSTAPGTWSLPLVLGDLSMAGWYTVEIETMWPGTRPQTFAGASFPVAPQIA
jgi:hypothetical protein